MKNVMQFVRHINELRNIMVIEVEVLLRKKVLDIPKITGDEVVHPDYVKVFVYKPVTQMRADKSGSAGNENTLAHAAKVKRSERILTSG